MNKPNNFKTAKTSITRRQFINRSAGAMAAGVAATGIQHVIGNPVGANERMGIGFIGTGGRCQSHLRAVHWLKNNGKENVEITAVCDIYRPRVKRASKGYGGKVYMDHRELLDDPNVDIVCIATPDHHHGYQAIDALNKGKDVYCEKPVTHWRQFDLIKKLAQTVKKSGRVFQLGTQGMYDSAWHQMKKLVQEGLIGQPIHAECGYFRVGDWGERGMPIDDKNAHPGPDLNWQAFLGDAPQRPFDVSRFFRWRMYEDYAGGPVTDLYPHSLTPVLYILGVNMPSRVVATGGKFRYQEREIPDTFDMMIDYPEKITVVVMGTQGNQYAGTGMRGAGSKIPVIRGWEGTLTVEGNEIVFIPQPPGNTWGEKAKHKAQRIKIKHGEDFVEYWRSFLNNCRAGNQQTLSPADLAYHTQTALIMGMWALRNQTMARFDTRQEQIII